MLVSPAYSVARGAVRHEQPVKLARPKSQTPRKGRPAALVCSP
ncbi:hypothetical protein [Comamonas avium]|nr:hypothetical protein [Comamonas avium]